MALLDQPIRPMTARWLMPSTSSGSVQRKVF
jgi:hypothetical protein